MDRWDVKMCGRVYGIIGRKLVFNSGVYWVFLDISKRNDFSFRYRYGI